MLWCGVIFRGRDGVVRDARFRIEHAKAKARGKEAPDCGVNVGLRYQTLVHSIEKSRVLLSATQVSARLERGRGGVSQVFRELVSGGNVCDGGAVGDDVPGEVPVSLELLLEQHLAGTGGRSIHGIVGAHNAVRMSVDDERPEGGQI